VSFAAREAAQPPSPVRAQRRTPLRPSAREAAQPPSPSPSPVRAQRRTPLRPSAREGSQPPALISGAREAPHASRPSAREGAQPHARKYVDLTRPWQDQITIHQQRVNARELAGPGGRRSQPHAFDARRVSRLQGNDPRRRRLRRHQPRLATINKQAAAPGSLFKRRYSRV
jgi:hypothetical protein